METNTNCHSRAGRNPVSFEKAAGSRPRSGRRQALRGDDKYSVCRLQIHDLNAPSNSSLLSLVPKHIGQSIERFEDNALLSGRGRFVDDLGVKPGASHAAILCSPPRSRAADRHQQRQSEQASRRARDHYPPRCQASLHTVMALALKNPGTKLRHRTAYAAGRLPETRSLDAAKRKRGHLLSPRFHFISSGQRLRIVTTGT